MNIIDTYESILAMLNSMNGIFDISIWEEYAAKVSEYLPEKILNDSSSYDFNKDILPVINAAINSREKLVMLHDSFKKVTGNLNERFFIVFGIDLPVDIILYLGLCNGAGWATTLGGRKTVLLGVEKIIELNWYDKRTMTALIYHELGHVWHETAGILYREVNTLGEKSLWQLYQEGVAMYCEQLLLDDFSSYHQDKNCWLDWCKSNKAELFQEFIKRIKTNESTQDFFGDWCNYKGFSDVGYYIGCEFIKTLAEEHSIDEIANLDVNTVYNKLMNLEV